MTSSSRIREGRLGTDSQPPSGDQPPPDPRFEGRLRIASWSTGAPSLDGLFERGEPRAFRCRAREPSGSPSAWTTVSQPTPGPRGLDYYTRTVFEIVSSSGLGAQDAIVGGGRYDRSHGRDLGGPDIPGDRFRDRRGSTDRYSLPEELPSPAVLPEPPQGHDRARSGRPLLRSRRLESGRGVCATVAWTSSWC